MSTVVITITAPTTGAPVDYYDITQVTEGVTTTTRTTNLVNTMTIPAAKTTTFTATATNAGGSTTCGSIQVTAPAASVGGPNDFFMTNAGYTAMAQGRGLSAGSGVVNVTMPATYRVRLKFKCAAPPSAEYSAPLGFPNNQFGFLMRSDGHMLVGPGGGGQDVGVNVCDGAEHIVEFQNAADSRTSSQTWVDGDRKTFGGTVAQITDGHLTVAAAGGTNPGVFFGDRPGVGIISEIAIFSDAPYANFQQTIPVNTGLLTGSEANLLRLWHLNNSGAAAV